MLKEESKLNKRNKDSSVPVDSSYISNPVVLLTLESNKLELEEKDSKKEVKNEKFNIKALLEKKKEKNLYTSAALEPEDLVLDLAKNYSCEIAVKKLKKDRNPVFNLMQKPANMNYSNIEGLEGYSNSDNSSDTALKKKYEKSKKLIIVIDFESLHEACEKWKKKMNKFKA
ncbi:7104_t:CDS:2 [Cetraspora pellucida]|uniref:7104_t:CDS:1 n=1 Tax=Cetraspora pellucida TaxID=1433469 RepID=A0ACA9N2A3_9GLOM|nr:7104_t:CDS:2 [Cetraspora pellucida]